MRLPTLSFFKKKQPKEYFLALLLQEETIRAVVFEEINGAMVTIGEGRQPLPAPIDDLSFDELLDNSDKAISQAENSLPDGIQSHKTIFGVKDEWTQAAQINQEHLATLKKLCEELDLKPIGFLVFAEAIAHLLQKKEGAPVSAVLIELDAKHISATLLRAGRVIGTRQAPAADDLPKTVDTLLHKFTDVEILPSRIILQDNLNRPHLGQQFTNHTWAKDLPFLHDPQIAPLPQDFTTQSILFGTATQMGFDIHGLAEIKNTSQKVVPMDEKNNEDEKEEVVPSDEFQNRQDPVLNEMKRQEDEQQSDIAGDNFGFVKDTDVLENMPGNPTQFHTSSLPDGENEDEFADEVFSDIPEEVKERGEKSNLPGVGTQATFIKQGMKKTLTSLRKVPLAQFLTPFNTFSFFKSRTERQQLTLLLLPLILILILGGLVWYFFGLHATATLIMSPKVVEASQNVTFSSTNATDPSSQIIGGTLIPISEDGKVNTSATGKKDIGDKAKGTVTIYNNDDSSHTIDGGTTITSSNGLKFVTAKDVSVASASGDIFSGTKPGTATVDVTASDIGTDYNLPSGTKFAFGSSTIIAAKNDSAFSGGSKKTITVVSQDDLDKLTKDLTDNLSQKAKADAQKTAGTDKKILPLFVSNDMSNKQFDKKVGDEASSVNLSATIDFNVLSYTQNDMDTIAQAIIAGNNQDGSVSTSSLTEDIQDTKVSDDNKSVTATLHVKAGLLPKIDTAHVAKELAGKSFSDATAALPDISQLVSVKAVLHPNLFFLPQRFPRIASHITVGIAGNE